MPVAPTPHTPLPPHPNSSDPENFDLKADALVEALEPFGDQMDALADTAYDNAVEAVGAASEAGESADLAEQWATSTDVVDGGFYGARKYAIDADASADAAANSAATAINAPGTNATSSTARSLTTGSKDFTLDQTGKLFVIGQNVVITRTSDPTKRMSGPIMAFAADVLTVDVQLLAGSGGPYSDWTIGVGGVAPEFASQAEAEAGTVGDKVMTPLRTAQAIAALSPEVKVAIIQDQKSSGTTGQTFTPNGWRARDANTEVSDPDGIVSVSSPQFTLGAGVYLIVCEGEFSPTSNTSVVTRSRLYNVTNAAVVAQGPNSRSTYVATEGVYMTCSVPVSAFVTLAGTTVFEYQTYAANLIGLGTGQAVTNGQPEVYSTITIMKLA